MRTTLNIEDDVLQAAKELARQDGYTVGYVLSFLAKRGLAMSKQYQSLRNGVPVLPARGEIITLEHLRAIDGDKAV